MRTLKHSRFTHISAGILTLGLFAACKKNGKFAGLGGDRDLDRLAAYVGKGMRFHTTQTDSTYLIEAASRRAGALRKAAGAAAA